MMVERGVWEGQLLHLPAFVQVSDGHDHISTCFPSQRHQGHRHGVQELGESESGAFGSC